MIIVSAITMISLTIYMTATLIYPEKF
ncbi:Hypothetical protein FNO222_1851 [Francisella orientalis]|uniref:Potassium-transporting ATPase subunit F n=1 Tax=Francisella orientalis TaxID=299583 RepID=A0ABM5U845_9GAMM|nr:hypothetical protein FNO12_1837 [Francisella orientalis FNO12]AKN87861.1 Hypothetical protein FNO24_1839 [Francisella orientalis FNO24]AKN89400.1 Hypothetical protein FNO190_1837 [Francisella orientalis]AKU06159.1 Hypothetical protein FNO01_1837 [Francisella orientalis]QEN21075.1 Hypothetical protein FNO39_1851 [Francisella orientalis]